MQDELEHDEESFGLIQNSHRLAKGAPKLLKTPREVYHPTDDYIDVGDAQDVKIVTDGEIPTFSEEIVDDFRCALCDEPIVNPQLYAKHLQISHPDQPLQTVKLTFPSIEDCTRWIIAQRTESVTEFVTICGTKTGKQSTRYYRCSRSARPKYRHETKKHSNQLCPATLKVVINEDGTVNAEGCLSHVGHELNVEAFRFSPEERRRVEELLMSGKTPKEVLTIVREEEAGSNSRLSRANMSHIYNIEYQMNKRYNMPPSTVIRCKTTRWCHRVAQRAQELAKEFPSLRDSSRKRRSYADVSAKYVRDVVQWRARNGRRGNNGGVRMGFSTMTLTDFSR